MCLHECPMVKLFLEPLNKTSAITQRAVSVATAVRFMDT